MTIIAISNFNDVNHIMTIMINLMEIDVPLTSSISNCTSDSRNIYFSSKSQSTNAVNRSLVWRGFIEERRGIRSFQIKIVPIPKLAEDHIGRVRAVSWRGTPVSIQIENNKCYPVSCVAIFMAMRLKICGEEGKETDRVGVEKITSFSAWWALRQH